jgi:hypothetical protein
MARVIHPYRSGGSLTHTLRLALAGGLLAVVSLSAQDTVIPSTPLATSANTAFYVAPGQTALEAGDLVVVLVAISDSTANGLVADDLGGTYSRVATATKKGGTGRLHAFVRDTLVIRTVVSSIEYIALEGGASGAFVFPMRIKGMTLAGAAAVRQVAVQNSSPGRTTPALLFAAPLLPNNLAIVFLSNATNPADVLAPAGFTAVADLGYDGPRSGGSWAYQLGGLAGTFILWSSPSASNFGAIGLEINR